MKDYSKQTVTLQRMKCFPPSNCKERAKKRLHPVHRCDIYWWIYARCGLTLGRGGYSEKLQENKILRKIYVPAYNYDLECFERTTNVDLRQLCNSSSAYFVVKQNGNGIPYNGKICKENQCT